MSAAGDPSVYSGTDVLKNKLNIRAADKLQEAERRLFGIRSKQGLPPGDFNYAHLKAIHSHLFQDVYAWAGEERTVDIAKDDTVFARAPFIEKAITKEFNRLKEDNYLKGIDQQRFAEKAADYYSELNAIHPFREGNGRALRAFFSDLAKEAGYRLDWTHVDRKAWLEASIQSFEGNNEPLEQVFKAIVQEAQKTPSQEQQASAVVRQMESKSRETLTAVNSEPSAGGPVMRDRDDELEQFKTRINLSEYAASQGYELSKTESSRNSAVMRGPGDDKLVITRQEDGHWVYFSVRDDRDNGSIVDFVQNRQHLNLGGVRQALRPWLGEATHLVPVRQFAKDLAPASHNREGVIAAYSRMETTTTHPYLAGRGISQEVLSDPRFSGLVRIDERGNAVFPHYDRQGLSGYEIKNQEFTGFSRGGEKGVWHSQIRATDTRLVFTESAIDALSYHALHPDPHTRYMSTGGALSDKQRDLIRGAMEKLPEGATVMLAFDRDQAGDKLAQEVRNLVPASRQLHLERAVPSHGKDWNEQLQQQPAQDHATRQAPAPAPSGQRVAELEREM